MIIKQVLSYLLHHANREYRSDDFYRIKDKIMTKYGKPVGFDVQFIDGKKCHSCNGSGIHRRYDRYGFVYDSDSCWRCYNGWYKRPSWVLLQRLKFGKYVFHKPIDRAYGKTNPFANNPAVNTEVIEGYINHTRTKFGKDALVILYLIYDWKGYWKRWYKSIGRGWYSHRSWWWSPRRWPNNIAHIIRYKKDAIPFKKKPKATEYKPQPVPETEDLPF